VFAYTDRPRTPHLAALALILLMVGVPLWAADTPTAWSPAERPIANALSNATLYTTIGIDVVHDLWSAPPGHRWRAAGCDALTYGLVELAVTGVKHLVAKERPDGSDRLAFPSGHTAMAFASISGWKFGISIPLAQATAYFRTAADKHDLYDVLGGAALGSTLNFAVSRIPACQREAP
jgi:membrane-associated phospholipid phosphatase